MPKRHGPRVKLTREVEIGGVLPFRQSPALKFLAGAEKCACDRIEFGRIIVGPAKNVVQPIAAQQVWFLVIFASPPVVPFDRESVQFRTQLQ